MDSIDGLTRRKICDQKLTQQSYSLEEDLCISTFIAYCIHLNVLSSGFWDSSKLFQLWNINFLGKCTLDFIVILGITYAEWSQPTLSFSFVNTLFGPVSVDKRSKNRIILMLLLETVRYSEISALTSLFIMFYLVCLVIIFPLCRFIVR